MHADRHVVAGSHPLLNASHRPHRGRQLKAKEAKRSTWGLGLGVEGLRDCVFRVWGFKTLHVGFVGLRAWIEVSKVCGFG